MKTSLDLEELGTVSGHVEPGHGVQISNSRERCCMNGGQAVFPDVVCPYL